jgi:hypothetical protein
LRGGLRAGRREAARDRGRIAVRTQRAGEQRTANIEFMYVTLEVSQLRGWLKACADCQGTQAGHTVRCGLRGGRREAAHTQRAEERAATVQI